MWIHSETRIWHDKNIQSKWNIVNDQPNTIYDIGNEIIYNTKVKSNIGDCNDACNPFRDNMSIVSRSLATAIAFKNCTSIIKYITKNYGPITGDAEDLDLVIPMYNILEYRSKYSQVVYGFIRKIK